MYFPRTDSKTNLEIEVLKSSNDSIKQYVDTGLELLANLDVLFLESDYDGKRILAGSLFTQKLIFGNDGCRTTQVNEVLDVLTRSNKGLEGMKKRKSVISDSLTVKVPFTVKLSNLFIEDLKKLSDAYKLLTKVK